MHAEAASVCFSFSARAVGLELEENLSKELQALAEQTLGKGMLRYGNAPKRALLYRCSEPFSKIATREFRGARGALVCFTASAPLCDRGRPAAPQAASDLA
jgi:hypothetical protein